MHNYRRVMIGLLGVLIAACGGKRDAVVNDITGADPLIPFELLLAQPRYQAPKLSPDGTRIVLLGDYKGVPNLMLAGVDNPGALTPLTRDSGRGLQWSTIWSEPTFRWMPNNTHVVYLRDDAGDENWTLYSVAVDSGETRQLTPAEGVRVRGLQLSSKFPDEVLFSMNDRDPAAADYYRVNVKSGELVHITSAKPFIFKLFDHDFRPRLALSLNDRLDRIFYVATDDGWVQKRIINASDGESMNSNAIDDFGGAVFAIDNQSLLAFSSQGLDTTALVRYSLPEVTQTVIALEPGVDVKQATVHPATLQPQAYVKHFTAKQWVAIDPAVKGDFEFLTSAHRGELAIESRSADDRRWLVSYTRPEFPTTYYLYARGDRKLVKLWVSNPDLAALKLSGMHPIVTKSSDGFDLVSYITYPSWVEVNDKGIPKQPQPTITIIHGGPSDERAQYGFAPLAQWITNRGYALFIVNFRGSPGFGKAFMDAQNGEWGGAMHRDVIEQVQYLVDNKMADPARLGVFGGSYGGYATLVAMTMTPDVFECGVAVVGPANLETFMDPATMPPDWSIDALARRVGDPRTAAGRKLLRERSPINHAHRTKGDVLVVQGDNDIRVPTRESDQIVAAMEKAGVDVTYLLYPDEGHGLIRQENNSAFMAVTEVFFGECLGGRYEPLGDRLEGSSTQVPTGVEHIPGLKAALAARKSTGTLTVDKSVDSAIYPEYAGEYLLEAYNVNITVSVEDGRLFVEIPGQGKHELLPFAADSFFVQAAPTRFVFKREGGAVTAMALHSDGGEQMLRRQP